MKRKPLPRKAGAGAFSTGQRPRRFSLKIEDLNDEGAGVGFRNKRKIAVPKTLPGERVVIEFVPDLPRKQRIHLLKVLEPSSSRQVPPCPYFSECGGCHLQHLSYAEQLRFKQQVIKKQLLGYPALRGIRVHPVVGVSDPLHYRNKCQMPFQKSGNKVVYGLFRSGTHEVLPIEECLVESRDANQALHIVRNWAEWFKIPIYDELRHEGLLRYTLVRKGIFTGQVMVVLVSSRREVPHWSDLLRMLKQGLPSLSSFVINVNPHVTNRILGAENLPVWGDPVIEERIGRYYFSIAPDTFFQINSVQWVRLLDHLMEEAGFSREDLLVDLFCGVGMISIFLSDKVKQIWGVENNPAAVQAARSNLRRNGVRNVDFVEGDAAAQLREFVQKSILPDWVIIDPPRKGIQPELIDVLLEMKPRQIVYISCNMKTLVRDLARLNEGGYSTEDIFPYDMFPHTYHVEAFTILRKL